jgi:hypothetical protein
LSFFDNQSDLVKKIAGGDHGVKIDYFIEPAEKIIGIYGKYFTSMDG